MAEPTTFQFDTNRTHLIAPVAGHVSDGYSSDETPGSDEFNGILNLIGQNLAFLKNNAARNILGQVVPKAEASGQVDPEYTAQSLPTDSIYALTPNPGAAFLKQGSANNKLKIAPGILMQLASGKLLSYTFDGTTEYTIANGDATNPRVDILQMKIDTDTNQNPTVTVSMKSGTAAASPTYPAPDAGYCVIAGIVVGATYSGGSGIKYEDTAGAVAVVHDQRLPMRVRSHTTFARDFFCNTASFTYVANNTVLQSTGAGVDVQIPVNGDVTVGRIIAVSLPVRDTAALNSKIGKIKISEASGATLAFNVIAGGNINGSGGSNFGVRAAYAWQWATLHSPSAGPTVQANANGMGIPIWSNGKYCPDQPLTTGTFPIPWERVGFEYVAPPNTAQIGPCTFFVAGGL